MPFIDAARSIGKRVFRGTPFYEFARRSFINFKVARDKGIFASRYPNAAYLEPVEGQEANLRERGYYSQYGQDKFLLSHFAGRPGLYVDIGCNEPFELSNSYALELAGWRGIAIDPMLSLMAKWAPRKATFHNAAISNRPETRDYVEIKQHAGWEHALSGFKEFVRQEDIDQYGSVEYPVQCLPLTQIVPEGEQVDVIMIDVEGAEMLVLDGIDLAALKPEIVMIENVSSVGGSEEVRHHMAARGYDIIARIGASDDVFRRR